MMRTVDFRRWLLLPALLFAACEGPAGPAGTEGTTALTRTSEEAAGSNCPFGGTKIEVGLDKNRNGMLDAGEVNAAATSYVCNGNEGGGKSALVKSSPEAAGTNCANGGVKIETGLDANGNGKLDDNEISKDQTSYICNGGTPASGPTGSVSPSTGVNVTIKEVSTKTDAPITVRFLLKDDRGFPIDIDGKFSVNTPLQPRFAIGWFTKDSAGNVLPLNVMTKSGSTTVSPTAYNPKGTTPGHGTITENGMGAGDYTYSFPTTTTTGGAQAVKYDATKLGETHVVWIQASRQTDLVFPTNAMTFAAANQAYYFVPNGMGTPLKREIVTTAACSKCHDNFSAETTTSNAFHGGGRIDATFCNVCHNPGRTSNPAADSLVFVHRIHHGHNLKHDNLFHEIAATYPQDIRNCDTCHKGAAQGGQAQTRPTRLACGSCHDYVDFTGAAAASCVGPVVKGTDGLPVACKHVPTQTDDSKCKDCHTVEDITGMHKPVVPPDPKNALLFPCSTNADCTVPGATCSTSGTSKYCSNATPNTHASYVAAVGYKPQGAEAITYDIKSVDAVVDATITPAKRPQITFKLKKDGKDVVFQTYAAGSVTEMIPNFVGSPSVYFAFAVPQDGNDKPADFNATASSYLKNIWNGTAITGTSAGTLTGPDASGYYTVKLTGVVIPEKATMLTGGLGYSYNVLSAPPLVQTNVQGYSYDATKKQGGLSVPAPNVWKVATGYTGRRAIVDNAKCNGCHGFLGVAPSFHAGQRNDGPTCAFCHTQNRPSNGWSAGTKYAFHALHAGRKRVQPFKWYAASPTENFGEIEFPAPLNGCKMCHVPNTYDFTATTNFAAMPNLPLTTVATGKYNADQATNPTYYRVSPFVVADNMKDYGSGFSFAGADGKITEAAGTTLVISPLTTVCSACHDTPEALAHMKSNGGRFYEERSAVLAANSKEQCMLCHGPGRVAAIGEVHH